MRSVSLDCAGTHGGTAGASLRVCTRWSLELTLTGEGTHRRGGCVQGATVFDMRYLATIVANCFLAFGEILQMNTRVHELSAGVARVAQLLCTTEAAEGLQRELTATNISGCCASGVSLRHCTNGADAPALKGTGCCVKFCKVRKLLEPSSSDQVFLQHPAGRTHFRVHALYIHCKVVQVSARHVQKCMLLTNVMSRAAPRIVPRSSGLPMRLVWMSQLVQATPPPIHACATVPWVQTRSRSRCWT